MKVNLLLLLIFCFSIFNTTYASEETDRRNFCNDVFNEPERLASIFREIDESRAALLHEAEVSEQTIIPSSRRPRTIVRQLIETYNSECNGLSFRNCFNSFRATYLGQQQALENISNLSEAEKQNRIARCNEDLSRITASRDGTSRLFEIPNPPLAGEAGAETASARRNQVWQLMSVSNVLRDRVCLDSRQRSFFEDDNSFINLQEGQSCNEFQGSTAADDNQGLTNLQALMSGFIGSQESEIDEFISMNGNQLFCDRCFREKYTAATATRDRESPPQDTPSTPIWLRSSDEDPNFADFRNEARTALTNHLVENVVKQELLKISIVMEQFIHAKAQDASFPHRGNESDYNCMNPERLMAAIQNQCGSRRIFRSGVMSNRIKNVFQSLGLSGSALNAITTDSNLGLRNGLNHIFEKVSTVSREDGSKANCPVVNRIDVARLKQRESNTSRGDNLFRRFFSALLYSDEGQNILRQFRQISETNSALQATQAQNILAQGLQRALTNSSPGNQAIRNLMMNDEALTPEQRNNIRLATGLTLPLDQSDLQGEQIGRLTGASFGIFRQMARYNPNMFMFINDPSVRSHFSNSADDLIENLFGAEIDDAAFQSFTQRCSESFEKIARFACIEDGQLEDFSKSDIAIAAQEITEEISDEDPKRRDLAVIALGSEVCQQKIDDNHANTPQYIDLDQQLPAQFSQSDFMRAHKRPHEFEDPSFADGGISPELRRSAILTNRENRLLNEASMNSQLYCNQLATSYLANESECLNHQRNCAEFTGQLQDDKTFFSANSSIVNTRSNSGHIRFSSSRSKNETTRLESLLNGIKNSTSSTVSRDASGNNSMPLNIKTPNQAPSQTSSITASSEIGSGLASSLSNPIQQTFERTADVPLLPIRRSIASSSSDEPNIQTPDRQVAIANLASRGAFGQQDLNALSTSELRNMADIIQNRSNISPQSREEIESEYNEQVEDLVSQREELQRQRERLRRSREEFEQSSEDQSASATITVAASSERAPSSISTSFPQPTIALPSSVTTSDSSSEDTSVQSDLGSAELGRSQSDRSQFALILENPESADALPSYLNRLESFGLSSESEYINFRENGRIIEIPGPNGRIITYVVSELSGELRRQIEEIRAMRQIDEINAPSLQDRERRTVMQVLTEQETEITNRESEINNRIAIYQEFLRVLQ